MSSQPQDDPRIENATIARDEPSLAARMLGPGASPLDIQDPLGRPAWHEPVGSLLELPYAAVGIVRVLQGGQVSAFGTCWRIAANTAITAAHVARAAQGPDVSLRIDFPDEPMADVLRVVVPDDYQARTPFDEWDIALLALRPKARTFLALAPDIPAGIQLVGFPASSHAMVESAGNAVAPDQTLLLHQADTSAGHSGGPLLTSTATGGAPLVVGLHIGGFSSNPFVAAHPKHNVALALREPLRDFIRRHA